MNEPDGAQATASESSGNFILCLSVRGLSQTLSRQRKRSGGERDSATGASSNWRKERKDEKMRLDFRCAAGCADGCAAAVEGVRSIHANPPLAWIKFARQLKPVARPPAPLLRARQAPHHRR